MDRGHVLGKIHVAETASMGKLGYAHRWDISMRQEVCVPADDSWQQDCVHRIYFSRYRERLLRGMSAVMRDRASVMKSFGRSLDQERRRILQTDEELQLLYCNAHFRLGLETACQTVLIKMEKERGHRLGCDRLSSSHTRTPQKMLFREFGWVSILCFS